MEESPHQGVQMNFDQRRMASVGLLGLGRCLQPWPPLPGAFALLLHRETVDAILLPELAGEAEAADTRVWKPPAMWAGSSDGEAHATVFQPASIATV